MFRIVSRLAEVLRGMRSGRAHSDRLDATAHLQSSRRNRERLNAAMDELNAGRGALTSMPELHGRLGEPAAR